MLFSIIHDKIYYLINDLLYFKNLLFCNDINVGNYEMWNNYNNNFWFSFIYPNLIYPHNYKLSSLYVLLNKLQALQV